MRILVALLLSFIAQLVSAQVVSAQLVSAPCQIVAQESTAVSMLWSSAIDDAHSRYVVLRTNSGLEVREVVRNPNLTLSPRFSIPISPAVEASVAFSQGDLVVSQWRRASVSGDNISQAPLTDISYYRLVDGSLNTARTQALTHENILPAKATSAPFYESNWPYSPWKNSMCQGSAQINAQQGRIVAAAQSKIYVANPGEQRNYCNTNANYYRYHLLPNGSPELQIVRQGVNSLGQPTGLPICDLQPGFPQVASCQGTAQDTCQALNSSGAVINIPSACSLRMEPRPVLAFEHCPTCPYWWSIVDPKVTVFQGTPLSTGSILSTAAFPGDPIPADPEDPGSIGLPPSAIQIGAITSVRADPFGSGFVVAAEMTSPSVGLQNYGGLFFFDQNGQYRGFGTTLVNESHVGENGAVAAVGRNSQGRSIYVVGSPRNRPRGAGGWNLPPEITGMKPEAGHVAYYTDEGDRLEFDFGARPDDLFGSSVAALGDANGDTSTDILIGAPGGRYAAISTLEAGTQSNARGIMYYFEAPNDSGFGQQVAAGSSQSQSRADTVVIASDQKLFLYDLSTCSNSLAPGIAELDRLRELTPPLLTAARGITPEPSGRIPDVRSAFSPVHPQTNNLTSRMPEYLEVLRSSPTLLPSNEEIRAEDLSRAITAAVLNLNDRDITRKQIVRLTNEMRPYQRTCKRARGTKKKNACKKAKQYRNKIAAKEAHLIITVERITTAKSILVTNLEEISVEISSNT
jgi:hypothetical protein